MKGKTALITGAAQRIGKEMALHLAKQSWNLALHYNRSKKEAESLRDYLQAIYPQQEFNIFACELSDEEELELLISRVYKVCGRIDMLINNASVFDPGLLMKTDLHLYNHQMDVNLKAPFVLMRDFAKVCKKGLIVNFLDTRITKFSSTYAAYSLSKVALAHLTQMGALEFGPDIRVNGIAPGATLPPHNGEAGYLENKAAQTPMKQPGGIQPILKSLNYICENNFLTGQILYCDGGEQLL